MRCQGLKKRITLLEGLEVFLVLKVYSLRFAVGDMSFFFIFYFFQEGERGKGRGKGES